MAQLTLWRLLGFRDFWEKNA